MTVTTESLAGVLKSTLSAATKVPVLDVDEAEELGSELPADYVLIFLSRRSGGQPRMDGIQDTFGRRLITRVLAQSTTNARVIEDRIADAFEHSTISFGDTFAHLAYESGGGFYEHQDGYYFDDTQWAFAI